MKLAKFLQSCAVVVLLFVFVACGGQDSQSDLLRANEQLQEEIKSLRYDLQNLTDEHRSLQAELSFVQGYLAASGTANQSLNGVYPGEFPVFYQDFQSLLNEPIHAEFSFEQAAWQNLSTSSTGRHYILWRGSWGSLVETQDYINLLVQHGWELVTMFSAGQVQGIVVVMRR